MSERPGLFDFAANKARNVAAWSATDWDDVARFIGPNADRFRRSWEATRDKIAAKGGGMAFGFCWPCLLFSFAWFFYRRLWAAGLAILLVPIVFSLVFESSGGMLGALIGISLFAKSAYVQHAVGKVARIRQAGGGDDEIVRAGGISVAGGAIGGLIMALGYAAVILSVANIPA